MKVDRAGHSGVDQNNLEQGENNIMATVRIPSPLRRYTNGQSKAQTSGGNVTEIINNLETQFPGVKSRLCDETGQIKT